MDWSRQAEQYEFYWCLQLSSNERVSISCISISLMPQLVRRERTCASRLYTNDLHCHPVSRVSVNKNFTKLA